MCRAKLFASEEESAFKGRWSWGEQRPPGVAKHQDEPLLCPQQFPGSLDINSPLRQAPPGADPEVGGLHGSRDSASQARTKGLDPRLSLGLSLPICPLGRDLPSRFFWFRPLLRGGIGAGLRSTGKEKGVRLCSLCLVGQGRVLPGGRSWCAHIQREVISDRAQLCHYALGGSHHSPRNPSRESQGGPGGGEMCSSKEANVRTILNSEFNQNRPSARPANRPESADRPPG